MKRERCPRNPNDFGREKRIIDINKQISPKYQKIFRELIEDYDKRPWENLGY